MGIQIINTFIPEVKILKPEIYEDSRGYFMEMYKNNILGINFIQDNISRSTKNVIRGLHLQSSPPISKLMQVIKGTAFLVAVDVRPESKTYKQYISIIANDINRLQLYAPATFARGFCILSDYADILYKTDNPWNPDGEKIINFLDPEINIKWPIDITKAITSDKDKKALCLKQMN